MSLLLESSHGVAVLDFDIETYPRVCRQVFNVVRKPKLIPGGEGVTVEGITVKGDIATVAIEPGAIIVDSDNHVTISLKSGHGRCIGTVGEGFGVLKLINLAELISVVELHNPYIGATKLDDISRQRAKALEIIGDVDDHTVEPLPQTIFVARLAPQTLANALEVVFGRFGSVRQVTLKTGYAFVEFVQAASADAAVTHFRDKGGVVDGRDLKVDYSQSTTR